MKQVLITPSIVTHDIRGMRYENYINARLDELRRLRLHEVSLFVTTANKRQREHIRKRVALSAVSSIPHIHIRNDMSEAEVAYYYETYGTRRFTTHYEYRKHFVTFAPRFRRCIGLENNDDMTSLAGIDAFGGLVIDVSHYASDRMHKPALQKRVNEALARFRVLANHASGVYPDSQKTVHWAYNRTFYTYIATIPKKCFAPVMSLEVSNTLETQLTYCQWIKKQLQKNQINALCIHDQQAMDFSTTRRQP